MKRIILILLILALMTGLGGCFLSISVEKSTDPVEKLEATLPTEITEPVTEPVVTEPAETVPETVPAVTEPEETVPATEPAVTEPEETVPATEPAVTEPEETVPATEPVVTEPEETEPVVTEPVKPTEPKPTDPKPTDPKPTEPPKVHSHSYKAKVVEPTCEEKGYTVHTCSCGDSYTDSEKAALGHDMHEDVTDPGPGYEGYTYHYCSRCDYSFTDNYTEALPTATAEDIEKAIIKYINQYRAAEGSTQLTYLPGMTQVAKYRSKQLTTNYAHDTDDIREAYAYYQYGEYIDATLYGDPPENSYYDAKATEAIGYASYRGTSDEIGKAFAELFHESSGHWRYVGSSEYSYTGVGVTKSSGRWYVCIKVGRVNYG